MSPTIPIKRIVTASSLGGALEMYDFIIYVFFAPTIASLFFNHHNHVVNLLATFGIFAIGYFARPLGGIIFGYYGDVHGRKKGLLVSMVLMGCATMLIGCLPTYAAIGVWAPVLLVACRLIQGIAMGGDLPGAMTYVAEMAPKQKRAWYCSWTFVGVNAGTLMASAFVTLLSLCFTTTQMHDWGWRLAFFSSVLILILGYYWRQKLEESILFAKIKTTQLFTNTPLSRISKCNDWPKVFAGIGFIWLGAVIISQLFLFMPTYIHVYLAYPMKQALFSNTLSLLIFAALIPFFGYFADKIGHKKMMFLAILLTLIFVFPGYALMHNGHLFLGLLCLDIFAAAVIAMMPVCLSELFPTYIRFTGIGISYNVGFAIFGGLTPMVLTYLLHMCNSPLIVVANILVACVASFIATATMTDRSQEDLH
jgi:MFS family permease